MNLIANIISHSVWLQRHASGLVTKLSSSVNDMRDTVRRSVLGFGDDNRTRRKLENTLRDIDEELSDIAEDWGSDLTDELKSLSDYEADWAARTLQSAVNKEIFIPEKPAVWSNVNFIPLALNDRPSELASLITGWGDTEVNRLVTGVKTGFVQGKTTRQIVNEVTGPGGLADISNRNAAAVVRTAVNHVSTQARETTYKKNSDIVEKYEWVSTLDSRTSTICRSRDGQKYDIGKGPLPPAHPNCRSATAPVISSEFDFLDKGAKRAAKGADGGRQVDASTTYYDFLKQQPAWFQDEAIGPVRGKIFRNSGISAEEFRTISVDGFGRPLTLNEMAALDKRVADYLENL